jgi:hypothetical protein
MSGFTYATLTTAIQNYTEVDSNVLTSTITDEFIENAEFRILRDVPIDAYKKQSIGNLVTGQTTINVPAKTLFVKGVQVYDSTSVSTGSNSWLEKKMKLIYKNIFQQKHLLVCQNTMLCLVEQLGFQILLQEDCFGSCSRRYLCI